MINKLQNYYGIAVRASTGTEMLGQLCIIVVNAILNVNDITVLGQHVCYQADQINGTYRSIAGIFSSKSSQYSWSLAIIHHFWKNVYMESLRRSYNTWNGNEFSSH